MYLSFYKGHETPGISSIDLLALCSGVFFVVSNYLIMSELNESEKNYSIVGRLQKQKVQERSMHDSVV